MPRCIFVTGPRGAATTGWLLERFRALRAAQPDLRCAVIAMDEGRPPTDEFARAAPGLAVQPLAMPCLCCPAAAGLSVTAAAFAESSGAEIVFVTAPAVAAAALIGELDRTLRWPRELVLCLDARWTALRARPDVPYFFANLLALADTVVPAESTPPPNDAPTRLAL